MGKDAGKEMREMKILSLGLPRTGSMSMRKALEILGYKGIYHAIDHVDDAADWETFIRAVDASHPVSPTYTGKPFTRDNWDELFGPYEAATDVASLFTPQLLATYPNTKVVVVIRDYDKWFASVNQGLFKGFSGALINLTLVGESIIGLRTVTALRRMLMGYFNARNMDEARQNSRAIYDQHHRTIKEMVPPEQLLMYHLGEGWEPLCKFLGKPVPDVDFPHENGKEQLQETIERHVVKVLLRATGKLFSWAAVAGVMGTGIWVASQRSRSFLAF
ncbi:hypothetical protein V8C35DRAFT_333607 [Trichoderma chlorosporum]